MDVVYQNLVRCAKLIEAHYVSHPELLEALLAKVGAEHIKHHYGRFIQCSCPIHMGNKIDGFRLWYDQGKALWQCFSDQCGRGGLTQLLMRRYNADFASAVTSLGRFAGMQIEGMVINITPDVLHEEDLAGWKRRNNIKDKADDTPNIFPETMVDQSTWLLYRPEWSHALDFLTGSQAEKTAWGDRKKHFPIEVLKKWRVGVIPARVWTWAEPEPNDPTRQVGFFEDRITIPWYTPDGQLMGFAGRRFDGRDIRKYKQLPGTKRAHTLYGLHDPRTIEMIRATREVVLVEGFGDVWRAHQHEQYNTLGVGGTEIAPQQMTILKRLGIRKTTMYYDGDQAGQNATNAMGKQLCDWTKVMLAIPPMDVDPGDIEEREKFCTPIAHSRPFTPKE